MLFVLSKLFWALAAPGNLLALLLVAAVLLRRRRPRTASTLTATVALALVTIGALPVGRWAASPLENRFRAPVVPEHVDGIVVLGGALWSTISDARGATQLNEAAERMTAALELARRHPEARVVFTGGSGLVTRPRSLEAPWAGRFLVEHGLTPERLLLEEASRNTWENAVEAKRVAAPAPGETWLLITSALHMPRSVGCFRRAGWTIVPYPVDFLTSGRGGTWKGFDVAPELSVLSAAFREWVGLVAYRALGRTDALVPAP